ncbi:DUF7344 domain-containing protein [Halorubrum sp. HHNYT27]|uniref:DUF7344 domain-containing protein n=1 Tax=Halorubrum sp. HHNYT27 TaxID=3402275 RepID=UPI003EBFAE49
MSLKGGDNQTVGEPLEAEEDQTVTKNDVFDVLKNERRRAVIRHLDDRGGSSTLSDVAERVAAEENDTTVQRISSDERKRVRIALYQCHLPRMDRMGIIDFDKDRGTIALRDPASQVLLYLDLSDRGGTTDASNRPAFVATVVVAAVVMVGALGVGPFAAIPPSGWTAVAALALVAIAGMQYLAGMQYRG